MSGEQALREALRRNLIVKTNSEGRYFVSLLDPNGDHLFSAPHWGWYEGTVQHRDAMAERIVEIVEAALAASEPPSAPERIEVEIKPATFEERAEHFKKIGTPVDWPEDDEAAPIDASRVVNQVEPRQAGETSVPQRCEFHGGKPKEFCGECAREMSEPYQKALEAQAEKLLAAVEIRNVRFGKKVYFLGFSMQGNSRPAQAVQRAGKLKAELAKLLDLATLEPGSKQEGDTVGEQTREYHKMQEPDQGPLAKAGEFDTRAFIKDILGDAPFVVQEQHLQGRYEYLANHAYAAGRAASGRLPARSSLGQYPMNWCSRHGVDFKRDETCPSCIKEAAPAPVSKDVRKLALAWKTRYCEHFNGAYCEVCTAQDLADALREERRKALEEAAKCVEGTMVLHGDHYASYAAISNDAADLAGAIRAIAAREGAGE